MKVCLKTKNSTYVFTCTAGHLDSLFIPAVGDLPVCFQKNPNVQGSAWGGGGEGDELSLLKQTFCILFGSLICLFYHLMFYLLLV